MKTITLGNLTDGKPLRVPIDAVTQTWGFFGRKGSGKTYAAGRLAELLIKSSCQVIVLDPIGNWYGLRLDKTGKQPSKFNIPILGGLHADIPLEPDGGSIVAEFAVRTGTSLILDVSQFRKNQRKDFVTDFAEDLFHRKKASPSPMHLILEECHVFAPQKYKDQERMLGAIEDIVRLGRNFGIGTSMISQRPQSVNTEVRNQCEPLVVFQLVAKHERDAIKGWMEHMGRDDALAELSRLKEGDCFFWSPAWLDCFDKIRFSEKISYDASETPKVGQTRSQPQALKPVDLQDLREAMSDTIEYVEANDPQKLKDEIRGLKSQLAQLDQSDRVQALEANLEELTAKASQREKELLRLARDVFMDNVEVPEMDTFLKRLGEIEDLTEDLNRQLPTLRELSAPPRDIAMGGHVWVPIFGTDNGDPSKKKPVRKTSPVTTPATDHQKSLRPAHRRILNALAWLTSFGLPEPARGLVAAVAGVSSKSSGYRNDVSRLSSLGLVHYPRNGHIAFTDDGRSYAEFPGYIPTLDHLHEAWLKCPAFRPAHRKLLRVIIKMYPGEISREQLADKAGISHASSGFRNDVSRLSSFGLIRYPRHGWVVGSDLLFPDRETSRTARPSTRRTNAEIRVT